MNQMKKSSIVLIDDHSVMRMGLISLLNTSGQFEVIGDAGNGEDGIRKALKLRPDVIITDLMMPGLDGVETTRRLLAEWPEAKILILTTYGSSDGLSHALEAGALGVILKSADWKEFQRAVASVATGKRYVSGEIEQIMSDEPPLPDLSPRQKDILALVVEGQKNDYIAAKLNITRAVVKEHITILFHKMGVTNRTEAVAIALRKHLLKM